MAQLLRDILEAPAGFRSREVALFVAQMDDQNRRLLEDLEGLTPAEQAWQPRPGMNSIGMLLAHIAVVEVFWMQIGVLEEPLACQEVLGIGVDDDGMPLAKDGTPPPLLEGKDLSFFRDLLDRARAYTKQKTAGLPDAALDVLVRRKTSRGTEEEFNKRWVFYHVLEHEAGHYGQILLLRHQYRASR